MGPNPIAGNLIQSRKPRGIRISYHVNPKAWVGIKWLATYISIRPGELVRVKEEDIDLVNGFISIPFPKEKKPKTVPL